MRGHSVERRVIGSLRNLVRLKARSLSQAAIESDGRVPDDQLEELARLGRLLDLARGAAPNRRPLWPAAAVFAGTVILVSLLAFGRTSWTEIVLDVEADEAVFRVPAKQIFLESIAVSDLGISGDALIELPEASGGFRHLDRVPVRLSAAPANPGGGSLDLSAVTVPEGTRVSIQYAGVRRRFRIWQQGAESTHRVSLSGPIDVTGADGKGSRMNFHVPRPLRVQCGKQGVNLDLTLPEGNATRVISNLQVSALEFIRVDEAPGPASTAIRRRSTVRGGMLYMESLNGRARALRPGELIRFEGADGEIRTVELKTDAVALQFHGWVTGIITGSLENPSSLMPTRLEWLRERKALYLFWGAALYLFGLAAGVMRWLRIELW